MFFHRYCILKVAYFIAYFPNTLQNYYYFTKYTDTFLAVIAPFGTFLIFFSSKCEKREYF